MGMRRDYMLSNCDIIFALLQTGHSHQCERCERGMHVKPTSGLCVWCYNEQLTTARAPQITRTITKHTVKRRAPRQSEAQPTP
jgi:hypothetical protein